MKKPTESEFSSEQGVAFLKHHFAAICSRNYLGVEFERKKSTESEFSSEQGVAFAKLHFAAILFAKLTPSFRLSLSEEINGK